MDSTLYWIGGISGVLVPLGIAWVTILLRHMVNDHAVELELKTKQAFLDGEMKGLNERISRLEDIRDFNEQRSSNRRRPNAE